MISAALRKYSRVRVPAIFAVALFEASPGKCFSQIDIEAPPMQYSETEDCNAVTDLIERIDSGKISLTYDLKTGYLKTNLPDDWAVDQLK
jgi:hypothetical protein